jgi:LCP family protein required for cell wall assembly
VAYAQPKRRRGDPLWARLMIVLGALLMTTSGGVIVGGKVLLSRYVGNVDQQNLLGGEVATDSRGHASIKGPINLLMVGIDERADNPAFGMHADSIIILHVNATHDRAYMVSIPRDSYVDIPAFDASRYRGGREKITTAFFFGSQNNGGRAGGFQLLTKTIRQLTGIRPNGGAIVNFQGFKAIVDALGGVDMCVDEEVKSIHIGWDKNGKYHQPYHINSDGTPGAPYPGITPATYKPGCSHFKSWEALDYCRQRDLVASGGGDYVRSRHQQQFIKAVAKQTTRAGVLANPLKLDRIVQAAGKALTFDRGGVSIEDWIFTLKAIDPNNIVMVKTNAGHFNPKTLPNGQVAEVLSDTSMELFESVRNDRVGEFAATHPDWVSREG